jgi:hypothetical protein
VGLVGLMLPTQQLVIQVMRISYALTEHGSRLRTQFVHQYFLGTVHIQTHLMDNQRHYLMEIKFIMQLIVQNIAVVAAA